MNENLGGYIKSVHVSRSQKPYLYYGIQSLKRTHVRAPWNPKMAMPQSPSSSSLPSPSLPAFTNFITIKLTHTNFIIWKTQVTPYLVCQDLFGFVDGTNPYHYSDSSQQTQEQRDWVTRDHLAMAVLNSSFTEPVLAQVTNCRTSREIWNILTDIFVAKSSVNVVQTRLQLVSIRKGNDSITDDFHHA